MEWSGIVQLHDDGAAVGFGNAWAEIISGHSLYDCKLRQWFNGSEQQWHTNFTLYTATGNWANTNYLSGEHAITMSYY